MRPFLLSAPPVEPLTLAEAKAWLRVDGSDEDGLISALIGAARLVIEAEARRLLIDQTWRLVLDVWPASGCIPLTIVPVRQILAARVLDAVGVATPVSLTALVLDLSEEPARIRMEGSVPVPGATLAGIEIDVLAGHCPAAADVPPPLAQAMRLALAFWFENRGDASLPGAPLPEAVARLIRPFQRLRL